VKLEERLTLFAAAIRNKFNAVTPRLIPAGGTIGQRLVKTGSADYAMGWADAGFATQILRTASNQASSVTSIANITGLSAAVIASGVYRVTGRVIFQTTGLAVGATIGFNGPAGSLGLMVIAIPTTALISTGTATIRSNGSSGSGTTTSVVAVGTPMVATIDGLLFVSTVPGNLVLQFASSSLLGTVTVLAGSSLVVEKIG
jgi:hypothetical protein